MPYLVHYSMYCNLLYALPACRVVVAPSIAVRAASSAAHNALCLAMVSGQLRRTNPPTLLYCNPSLRAMELKGSVVVSYSRTASAYFSVLRRSAVLPFSSLVMPSVADSSGSCSCRYLRKVSGFSPNSAATAAVESPPSFSLLMAGEIGRAHV